MISRYEAWLNGIALSSISPDILLLDIQHTPASIRNDTYAVAKRQGARLYRRYVESASVQITFAIRAYSIRQRQDTCNEIIKWAKNGGILQTNDREGQRLRCICDVFPAINSALRWTDPLTMRFTAYALPFWEEEYPVKITLTQETPSGTLYVPGNVDGAFAEVTILPQENSSMTEATLTANDRTMSLSGITVSKNYAVTVSYDDNMIQSIQWKYLPSGGSGSYLNKRTGVDDLVVKCGETNSFSYTANRQAEVEFSVRGLWM